MSLKRPKLTQLLQASVALLTVCISIDAAEFVTNGNFSSNNFPTGTCTSGTTCNVQFDNNYGAGASIVTGWTATGYSIYFIAGKQTTQNAVGQFTSTGKEMLDAASTTLSPTGGNFVGLDADPKIGSTVSQTLLGLTIGKTYVLTYSWAASQLVSRTGNTYNDSVQVSVGNLATDIRQSVNSVTTLPSGSFSGWYSETVVFVANNSSETLKFLAKSTSTCLPPFILLDGISVVNAPEPATVSLMAAGAAMLGLAGARRKRARKL